jgi:hypothetical protein
LKEEEKTESLSILTRKIRLECKLSSHKKVFLNDYLTSDKPLPVFAVRIKPNFNPIDINLKFLMEEGWTNADRFRFHFKQEFKETKSEIMNELFSQIKPHILIRKYDKPEDCFLTIQVNLDGTFNILSNDEAFADKYLKGLFLEFPHPFIR